MAAIGVAVTAIVAWRVSESALPHAGTLAGLRALTVGSLVGVACLIWWQRPTNRFGPMLAALGFVFALTSLTASSDPTAYTVGRAIVAGQWVLLAYVFLSFPHGVIEDARARWIPAALAALTVVLWVPILLLADRVPVGGPLVQCAGACPDNPLQRFDAASFVTSALHTAAIVPICLGLLATGIALAHRLRTATRLERRTIAPPLIAMAGLLFAGVPYILLRQVGAGGPAVDALRAISIASTIAIPYSLILGMTRGRVFAGTAARKLISRLGAERPTPARVRTVLADALQDPTLELAFWLEDRKRYADDEGKLVEVPPSDSTRGCTLVGEDGGPLAAILHDPALSDHPDLLETAGAAAMLSLKNARLEADLRASIRELRDSRARIVSAADAERRRLERDLHDGAQQQFIALRMKLAIASELLHDHDGETARMLDEVADEAESALASLRELVHGVYPSLLADHGLGNALHSMAREAGAQVRVEAQNIGRFSPELEAAVYFCCLEAVQNASKHAGPGAGVEIRLHRMNGQLMFKVEDHGHGFDQRLVPQGAGTGLMNMRDRIGAAGGGLEIESVPGSGTMVAGHVPVA